MADAAWIPGSGWSPGGRHGNPLQYSHLENPTDKWASGLQSIGSQRDTTEVTEHIHTILRNHINKNSILGNSLEIQWLGLCFHCTGQGLIPGQGSKIWHATWCSQKQTNKKKQPKPPQFLCKHEVVKINAPLYSLQHYLQQSRYGNNLNEWIKKWCGVCVYTYKHNRILDLWTWGEGRRGWDVWRE